MTPTQFLLVGFPYSGKTTLAKELEKKLGFARINIDELKAEKGYGKVGDDDVPDSVWDEIFNEADRLIFKYLKEGKHVASEYAWITKAWRDRARKVATDAGSKTKIIYLDIPLETIKKRWLKNKKSKARFHWPEDEFNRYLSEFEKLSPTEEYITYDQTLSFDEWVKINEITST